MMRGDAAEGIKRADSFVRSRCGLHMTVNTRRLLEEALHQGHSDYALRKAIAFMVSRQEVQEKHQGRILRRIR